MNLYSHAESGRPDEWNKRRRLNKAKRMLTHAKMLFPYDEDGPYWILYQALVQVNQCLSLLNRKHQLIRGRVMRHWCQDCITYEKARYVA
jgi:hypothetical protein